jgi:murein peptide amidase A
MQRLGRNHGRYNGESIKVREVLEEIQSLANDAGWEEEIVHQGWTGPLRAYRRRVRKGSGNVYLSAGIHGDEPAGTVALLTLFREKLWPDDMNLWVCPCLNDWGLENNQRENERGVDLNRNYRQPTEPVVKAHIDWLKKQPRFDVTILLHEDWEASGFYLYELNPENRPSAAEAIVNRIGAVCPVEKAGLIDQSWKCAGGIIRPEIPPKERPEWAEALWLIVHKSGHSYTLETPSDYPLELRVRTQVEAVKVIFEFQRRSGN